MPRIEPVPVAQLPQDARALIDAGIATGMYQDGSGLPPSQLRVMAYNSVVLQATYAQQAALWHRGLLEPRIRELVRIRSAQVNGCDACAAAVKEPGIDAEDVACLAMPGGDRLNARERAALDIVVKLARSPDQIDDSLLASMLDVFSPAELVELVYYASSMLGQHRFHHVFRSYEEGTPLVAFEPALIDAPLPERVATQG
jgi:alkylhydroperoxidase family enzyme